MLSSPSICHYQYPSYSLVSMYIYVYVYEKLLCKNPLSSYMQIVLFHATHSYKCLYIYIYYYYIDMCIYLMISSIGFVYMIGNGARVVDTST